MSKLKPISLESVPRALEKAERYRLLNEPFFAESICLDVLALDPNHQRALVIYILALSDQFAKGAEGVPKSRAAVDRLKDPYDRLYYAGILSERRAASILERGGYGVGVAAWHHIQDAMRFYEQADALQQDSANDDAILRYNTCLRLIDAHRLSEPEPDTDEPQLE
jgi:hypothetical protein